ncbi:MAG TPA: trypsin-like peptidase domain-containing protein [Vicinamibacteria bacterium]|nr:trypsin-like peptidase domain-containing protein [Vicinamibacteria bacterium]
MRIRSRFFFLGSLFLGVVLGLFVSAGLQRALSPSPRPAEGDPAAAAQARPIAERSDLDPEEKHTIALFKSAQRSVAYITTQVERVDFWTRNVLEVPQGTGSGFVWDDRGHVVTNFHVVQDSDSQKVTLGDTEYDAKTVGVARDQDIAVLRIVAPRDRLVPIRVGTSADLQVGQKVYAIGNPFGLDFTLTRGIVSALGRTIQGASGATIFDVVQTDAAINPGNSGGPLLDSSGRLIGVNTAIYSPSGASAGIGFAVPVDTVSRVVPQLIAHGRVIRPILGVGLDEHLSVYVTRRLGVEGVLLRDVDQNSGAGRAGLRGTTLSRGGQVNPGDVVQEIDGKPVKSTGDLQGRLGDYRPGDTVTLTVWRDGKTRKVQVRLQAPD